MAQASRIAFVSVADAVDVPPEISAAILLQVTVRLDRWVAARNPDRLIVPRLDDFWLERGGRVWWCRGKSIRATVAVRALGHLLQSLLARGPERRANPGLVYVASRATDPRHLAPIRSLREFAAALARHAPSRPRPAIDALIARHLARATAISPLGSESTIADVRRWRRAGGTSLRTIGEDTHIPVSLLRELEWGVFDNWMLPHAAPSLAAYARRAGLEPSVVLAVVAREQQQWGTLVSVRQEPAALLARRRGMIPNERAVPFALAAALLCVLAIAAPVDSRPGRSPVAAGSDAGVPRTPVEQVTPASHTQEAGELDTAPTPAGDSKAVRKRAVHRPGIPATAPAMKRAGAAMGSTPAAVMTVDPATEPPRDVARPGNPLLRFAKAIAGDGRHRVEPFPRPAGEEPPP